MSETTPRIRSLLRQAQRVADAGKREAAVALYEKIIEEAPTTAAAWVGLAEAQPEKSQKQASFERALALDPQNKDAQRGLAILRGDIVPQPEVVVAPAAPKVEETKTAVVDEFDLVCYRHPDRETGLRCYNCNKPICSECARKTPVGYLCPDCYREKEDLYFNAKPTDYLVAPAVALPLSLIAGYLVVNFGSSFGFFSIIIMIFLGGAIGGFIGRMAKRAIGQRRGRYLPPLVAAMVILGVLIPAIPLLIGIILSGFKAILILLVPGIYLFVATSAAYYQVR
jgi:hypothetical protein